MSRRLAFVVQRYGLDIAGGAEYHCRLIAERLARRDEVEVLTTCARDYVTWSNHYPRGVEVLNGVTVRRFPVAQPRDEASFSVLTARVLGEIARVVPGRSDPEVAARASRADALAWLAAQGPVVPDLVRHLEEHALDHDAYVFFSYRYWTTWHGLQAVRDRALLVPTAEDDGVYRLPIFPPLFRQARALVFNSIEERTMLQAAAGQDLPGEVVGVGSELPDQIDPDGFRRRHRIEGSYLLYVGRIDRNKGCPELVENLLRYRRETGSNLRLVLIGRAVLPLPDDPALLPLGFLSDQEKWDALSGCLALAMPSPLESLSMVTLEAFWAERPVLANARCDVLRGQCRRSNGGLYYATYDEFEEALSLLERDELLRQVLGKNGRRYFETHYDWEVVEQKYHDLLGRYVPLPSAAGAPGPPA